MRDRCVPCVPARLAAFLLLIMMMPLQLRRRRRHDHTGGWCDWQNWHWQVYNVHDSTRGERAFCDAAKISVDNFWFAASRNKHKRINAQVNAVQQQLSPTPLTHPAPVTSPLSIFAAGGDGYRRRQGRPPVLRAGHGSIYTGGKAAASSLMLKLTPRPL